MFGPCLRLLQGLRGSKPQPLSQGLGAVLRKFVGRQQQQRPKGSRAVNLTDLVSDDLDEWRNPVESEIALPSTRPRCCLARDKRIECATTVELLQHWSSTEKRWRSAVPEIRAMAAPSVALDAVDSGEIQRVSVHVSNGAKQLVIVDNRHRVKSVAKQRPIATDPLVGVSRVDRTYKVHRIRQPAVGPLQNQVIVVTHQAVRNDLNTETLENLLKKTAELDSIRIGEEDRATIHSPVHHMMHPVLDVHSVSSPHLPIMLPLSHQVRRGRLGAWHQVVLRGGR